MSARNAVPIENRLLAALPRDERERILPKLRPVMLTLGQVLYEAAVPIFYAYFLSSGMISLLSSTGEGKTIEVGVVGNEGVVGVPLFLGASTMPYRAVVQVSGSAVSIEAHTLRDEFRRSKSLQVLLLRYTNALHTQITQSVVCSRFHATQERLCRRLLMSQDLAQSRNLELTQEILSFMLGIRRSSVSLAAGLLEKAGLIRYRRGLITILDRKGLEASSCECYRIITAAWPSSSLV